MSAIRLHTLPGSDNVTRVELPNGITVLTRANPISPSVVINGSMRGGSELETPELLGVADFSASARLRGTENFAMHTLYARLEEVGASLGIGSGFHTTSFSGRALTEDLDLLLELAAEGLRRPIFPEAEIEKLRAQILTSLALSAQDTGDMAIDTFDRLLYGDHPLGRSSDGTPETIRAITRQDLLDFHQRHSGPQGMIVVIVGGITPEEAVAKVARHLGDWHNPAQILAPPLPPVPPLTATVREHVKLAGKSQTDIVLGGAAPDRFSPYFRPAHIGNQILGVFGMMGRLGQALREDANLAYSVGSSYGWGLSGPGEWSIAAGVAPEDTEQALDLILAEVRRFASTPVSAEELADTQNDLIRGLSFSFETNGAVASALRFVEQYGLGLDYYRQLPAQIEAVTPAQILEVAAAYYDVERIAIASAGP
jgi:zinc protease